MSSSMSCMLPLGRGPPAEGHGEDPEIRDQHLLFGEAEARTIPERVPVLAGYLA
jgi:hypothetical protein